MIINDNQELQARQQFKNPSGSPTCQSSDGQESLGSLKPYQLGSNQKPLKSSQEWWFLPLIPALKRQRHVGL